MSSIQQDDSKEKEAEKKKEFDEDIPVCICGKPYVVLLTSQCYDGTGVACDECGKNLPLADKVYHCPADKNNILHDQGYDVCVNCYNKLLDQVNTENILFQIWFIINCLDKELYFTLTNKFDINSRKSLISKSSYEMYQFIQSINWNELNDNTTTKKLFYDKYDELRKTHLSLKKSAYKFAPQQQQQQQLLQQQQMQQMQQQQQIQQQQQQQYAYNNRSNLYNNYQPQIEQQQKKMNMSHSNSHGGSYRRSSNNSQRHRSHHSHKSRTMSKNNKCASSMRSAPQIYNSYNVHVHSQPLCASTSTSMQSMSATRALAPIDKNIGFSVGGAQDINAFRNCIEHKQIPQINSITYEGIFNEYYFDTNGDMDEMDININENATTNDEKEGGNRMEMKEKEEKESNELPIFYPSYSYSKSMIPNALIMANINNDKSMTNDMIEFDEIEDDKEYEHFVVIGLNSNICEKDFQRKKLNLIVVLDISGSMGSTFNNNDNYEDRKTKMEVANQCLLLLLTHLTGDDRFGLVLFNNYCETKLNISKMSNLKMEQIEDILNISERGGTNFEQGYKGGISMFNSIDLNDNNYENRLIFLTDARPNSGSTNSHTLLNLVKNAATNVMNSKRIYSTFIGIGVDFNSDLISEITNVRGCNYFSVHTNKEFKKKLHSQFDYFVSPMVFNLELNLFCEGSKGNSIENVFGSNNINIKNGEIMNIKTLFPSPPNEYGDHKGGIILIQLNKKNVIQQLPYFVSITFEDKFNKQFQYKQCITLIYDDNNTEIYPNDGIRKGLLLTRYVCLLKDWIKSNDKGKYKKKQIFKEFKKYFQNEMKYVKDHTLKQEIKILNQLINW